MNGSIPDEKLDEIRRRVDIASLIGEYVTLRKAGRNYLGLCPFHREKSPSFTVSPDKQMFYCFGCGEGGNVFSFLMKLNHLTFPEAARLLARKTGVVIPERAMSREDRERYSLAEQLRQINEIAAALYAETLQSPTGEGARAYLRQRGIGDSAIATFRLGFAPPGWDCLLDHLKRRGIAPGLAVKAGLLVERAGKAQGYYDRFRDRVMIPIEDVDGRVIAFGGRLVAKGEPKYMNSPESPIYTKGNTLYGLARTREAIRELGFALMVEGYFDLISLWSAGIANVVALLGTAMTRPQVDLIRRYTARVAAVFDPDEAGRKALARSLELFLAGNVDARAVILPEGLDPDDFVRRHGRQKMEAAVAEAWPMAEYYIEQVLGHGGTLGESRERLREAVAFLSRLQNDVDRNLFLKKVAEALGVDQDVLKKEVRRGLSRGGDAELAEAARSPKAAELDPLELSLVRLMLENPAKMPALRETAILECFKTEPLKSLAQSLLNGDRKGKSMRDASFLVEKLTEGPVRERLLAELVKETPYAEGQIDRLLDDTVRKLRERADKEKGRILTQKIREAEREKNWELAERLKREWETLRKGRIAATGP